MAGRSSRKCRFARFRSASCATSKAIRLLKAGRLYSGWVRPELFQSFMIVVAAAGPSCSTATAEPPFAHGVAGRLPFAEELLVAHDRLVRVGDSRVIYIGLVVRH